MIMNIIIQSIIIIKQFYFVIIFLKFFIPRLSNPSEENNLCPSARVWFLNLYSENVSSKYIEFDNALWRKLTQLFCLFLKRKILKICHVNDHHHHHLKPHHGKTYHQLCKKLLIIPYHRAKIVNLTKTCVTMLTNTQKMHYWQKELSLNPAQSIIHQTQNF